MRDDELRRIAREVADAQKRIASVLRSPAMKAFLEAAEGQQRRLNEALRSPAMKAFLEAAEGQQRRLNEALRSPAMKAFLEAAEGQQRRIRETLSTFGAAAARAVEAYQLWDEGERRILDLLVPRGWLISPDTSLSEIHELLRLADEEGVDAVEEALVAALTPARCREIVEGLYERPSFAAWSPVLEQATAAHERGLYALSVPVWLIALDGIFLVELGIENVFTKVHKKKGSRVRAVLGPGTRARLVDALIAVIQTVAVHFPRGATPSAGKLRRHAIFHGLDPKYGTEKASIQGVLLLEALHYQLEASVPREQQ